jgi:hypothetical protein
MEPEDKMGFPPGIAEQMVFQHFKKYQDQHFKKFPPKKDLIKRWEAYNIKQRELAQAKATQSESSKVEELKGDLSEDSGSQKLTQEQKVEMMNNHIRKDNQERVAGSMPQTQPTPTPEPKKQIPKEMQDISTYNGDSTEKYKWSQDITEVIVQIDLPPKTSAKQITVDIKTKNLKVVNKNTGEELINGELFERIHAEDSFWSIEDGERLILTLTKAQEVIWKTIILGDKEIDPKQVDNSKRLDEFDVETQGHLHKVLYEQNRKLNGLPTTEEMEQQKLMEKVFNAENSPYKDTPYDKPKYGEGTQIPFKN